MLVNDSVTVAVEIPIYLTATDLAYYRHHGFDLNFDAEVVTGHIDFLQIRNGWLHILDYKPGARKETHAHVQLTHLRTSSRPQDRTTAEALQMRLV